MTIDDELLDTVLVLLPEVSRRLNIQTPLRCEMAAVPVGQARAMAHLFQHGVSTVSEVAAGIGVSLATASELIDRLVDAGNVRRDVNPKDRRQHQLSLVPEAVAWCLEVREVQREQLRAAAAGIDPNDWAAFVRGMTAVAKGMREPVNING
jgi:DNA-binding MarR family transcriptional regulator